jgi:hypothetical protein
MRKGTHVQMCCEQCSETHERRVRGLYRLRQSFLLALKRLLLLELTCLQSIDQSIKQASKQVMRQCQADNELQYVLLPSAHRVCE